MVALALALPLPLGAYLQNISSFACGCWFVHHHRLSTTSISCCSSKGDGIDGTRLLSQDEAAANNKISRPIIITRSRRSIITLGAAAVPVLSIAAAAITTTPLLHSASALQPHKLFHEEEEEEEEDRLVSIFQETSSSVVFIKDVEIEAASASSKVQLVPQLPQSQDQDDDDAVKLQGTGSGFIWDKFGHIVTNYHVVSKLATDNSGLQRCKIYLVDATGNHFAKQGDIVGFDPAYDLAVLKVDLDGHQVKPVAVGSSGNLRVGQSCFAIGNPFGYQNTLTKGVVSGLGREIPSPDGRAIRGAIQTDAAINSGNSGGPLIDSYGHVIGVNTATFSRKGSGVSSGVNFAIPIDTVMRTVPYLIVYGTPYSNRF